MYSFKSIKLYFFSILKLFFLKIKNFYFKTRFYNKKLISHIPDRIYYNPSTYLSASLITMNNDFYNIKDISPEKLWEKSKYAAMADMGDGDYSEIAYRLFMRK